MAAWTRRWWNLWAQAGQGGPSEVHADRPAARRRTLRLEPLEERNLLAVDLISANLLAVSAQRASGNHVISNDGRYVVFESTANDLVPNDTNAASIVDIFRRDTVTGVTQLVSSNFANTSGGNGSSSSAVISSDGRYVAFVSTATDLQATVTDPNGAVSDVFLRDMVNGVTVVVSRSISATTANGASSAPSISLDGRFVAFQSSGSDLAVPGFDTNNAPDVFVFDRTSLSVALQSFSFSTGAAGNGSSTAPVISGNGTVVAWTSTASDLSPFDSNGPVQDIFARVISGGTTQLITSSLGGGSGNGGSSSPSISNDGRFIAFTSLANDMVVGDNNGQQDVYVRDRTLANPRLVSIDFNNSFAGSGASAAPVISRNGQFVAFTSTAINLTTNDINGAVQDVFRRDILNNTTQLTSLVFGANGSGNGASAEPVISLDGRYVAFSSQADNLVTTDTNGNVPDVFRRDLLLGVTTLLSFNASGLGSGNGASFDPAISDDGLAAPFASIASDLVINDVNGAVQDVFLFASSNQIVVTSPDRPGGPHIRVFDARNLSLKYQFFAYSSTFTGGVRVATADVNNDTIPDIITAPGPGGGPHIQVFSGANPGQRLPLPIGSFFAYNPGFTGGVFVAAAFIDGDAFADIITGADTGGDPHVKVFSGANGALIASFFAYGANFTGGVRVAAGNVNGDGFRDIIVGSGPGMVSNYTVFNGATNFTTILASVSPYGAFGRGVYVSAGDLNGDGRADIVTGAGALGTPHVRAFSGLDNSQLLSFFAYPQNFTGGVRVGTSDADANGLSDILAAAGPSITSRVRVFSGQTGALRNENSPYGAFAGGVFAAGSKVASSGGSPLLAAPGEPAGAGDVLDQASLRSLIGSAIDSYAAAGLSDAGLLRLQSTPVVVADLPGDVLGLAQEDLVVIDIDASGRGWYLDSAPGDNDEYVAVGDGSLLARKGRAAQGVDLLTVLVHELGHVLGLVDRDPLAHPGDPLADTLGRGQRRLPTAATVDELFGGM